MCTNCLSIIASRGSVDISSPYENMVRLFSHSAAQGVANIFSRTAFMAGPSAFDMDTQYASMPPTTWYISIANPSMRLESTLHRVLVGRAVTSFFWAPEETQAPADAIA